MKVARWKVLGVAGALVLGYAVTTQAAQIKVDEDTFADFGYNMKIMYQKFDERGKGDLDDWKKNVFDIKDSRFYISGQVSKMVQFYGEWNASGAYGKETGGYAKDNKVGLAEGGVNFVFMPELQVRAGKVRVPFTRYQMTSSYSLIVPTDAWYDKGGSDAKGIFKNIKDGNYTSTNPLDLIGRTDGGLVVHGDIANGMFRYNVGVFNEDKRSEEAFKGLQWVARVEFTPTMLGFAPESTTSPHGKV
ncbi:porin, partial [Thermodesulfobacterium commune]|uniref:porin n=1 Tax=Thermodesulfobacterium commune TaxID=1741 RepID=UPI002FD959EF